MGKTLFLILVSVLITSGAWAGNAPDFSNYPQTEAFRFFLSNQTNGAAHLTQSNLLAITKFTDIDKVATVYAVTQDRHENDSRWVYQWAMQNSHAKRLSGEEMERLRTAIGELPAHNEAPPIGRLVMVSFQSGTNWVTRTYDTAKMPEGMTKILGVIGAD